MTTTKAFETAGKLYAENPHAIMHLAIMAFLAIGAPIVQADTPYVWSGGSTVGGISSAKEFADGANWTGGSYPNTADAAVDVTSSGSGGFLSLYGANVLLKSLKGSDTVLFGDKELSLSNANGNPAVTAVRFCIPVRVLGGTASFSGETWVSDCFQATSLYSISGLLRFCDYSWIPPVEDGVRVYGKIQTALEYYGEFKFYSPRAASGSYSFTLTEGSCFAKGKVGYAVYEKCSAGQAVSGTGIDEDTYVKRILSSTLIELSKPATASVESSTLTFASQTVKAIRQFGTLGHNGSTDHGTRICINRNSESEDYAVEVDTLSIHPLSGSRSTTILSDSGYIPGRLIVHNVKCPEVGQTNVLYLGNCLLQFAEPFGDQQEAGLPWTRADVRANSTATLCVTGTMQAVIAQINPLSGALVKTGTGTLTAGVADGVNLSGSVTVKEGIFGFADDLSASDPVALGALTVKTGAAFVVPIQGIAPATCVIEPGATIAGRGTLHLQKFIDLSGITVAPDVVISFDDATMRAVMDVPSPAVPGDPAFWVDCSLTNKMTLVDMGESNIGVYRIDDVRKTSDNDGYLFSTNCAGGDASLTGRIPTLKYDREKDLYHVYFYGAVSNPNKEIDQTDAHAWSRPVADIKIVFEVFGSDGGTSSGSAPFLGATSEARLRSVLPTGATFAGDRIFGHYSAEYPLFSWATAAMKSDSTFTVNGEVQSLSSFVFPYASQIVEGVAPHFYPMVTELTLPADEACHIVDSYTFCQAFSDQRWCSRECKHLCELIVYTNELSSAEVMSVRRYLMRKWLGKDASCSVRGLNAERVGTVGAIAVPAGASCYVEGFADNTTFRAVGEGTVYVENGYAPGASVKVESGTLRVRSFGLDLSSEDGIWAHFDASKIDDDHFDSEVDNIRGVRTVTAWKDVKPGTFTQHNATLWKLNSTNRPYIAENALNGLSVLDFGSFITCEANSSEMEWKSSGLLLPQARGHKTVVAVWGSRNGGGSLLGEIYSYWGGGYGLARGETVGGSPSDPILRNESHLTLSIPASYECRKNGVSVPPLTTGLSGEFDIVSFTSWVPFGAEALQVLKEGDGASEHMGGGQFGEMFICDIGLSTSRLAEFEAYLNKKWFNRDTDGYRQASIADLSVSSGATLEVTGGGALSVAALSLAGGTVRGSVLLGNSANLNVVVNGDGSVSPVTIDGTIDLSNGGSVSFSGATNSLNPGRYVLLTGIGSATVGTWTVDRATLPRRNWNAIVRGNDNCLVIDIFEKGFSISIR